MVLRSFGISKLIVCFSFISDSMNSAVTLEVNAGYIVGVVGFTLSSVTSVTIATVAIIVFIKFKAIIIAVHGELLTLSCQCYIGATIHSPPTIS